MDEISGWNIAAALSSLLVSVVAWIAWRLHMRVDRLERETMSRAEIDQQISRISRKLDALSDKGQLYRDESRTEAQEMLRRIEAHLDDLHRVLNAMNRENEHRFTVLEQRLVSSSMCAPCSPSLPSPKR